MLRSRIPSRFLVLLVSCGLFAGDAAAQRGDLERRAYEDRVGGYRLKLPKEWPIVPVTPDMRAQGLALQADAERDPDGGHLRVVLLDEENGVGDWVEYLLKTHFRGAFGAFEEDRPELDETIVVNGVQAHHQRWLAENVWVDFWVYDRDEMDVGLLFTVDERDRYAKSWLSAIERAAKGVELFEPSKLGEATAASYAERLEQAREQATRTPGWAVFPTPTEKFILTTSCDDKKFINEVIERLESARTVFEEDYPPPPEFKHVSIVRLCREKEEFDRYGGTSGGVVGWFNPGTTELVLFDGKDIDRNMSYAVMTHEAFHQYCFFLFGRAEAHRWFDEGHGDYYGGIKFNARGKPKITSRMPAGLERLTGAKELIQTEQYKPLREHLFFNHREWQTQGPRNVSCYEQSWSIVYMLRQGMLGKVTSKVWRDEYAQILPAYISTLRKGFEEAFATEREKRQKAAEEAGAAAATSSEVVEISSHDLDPEIKAKIWKDSMDAAWGKIDLDQFEEDWKLYVKKYLDD